MVEVFKTNITNKVDAAIIIADIHQQFPSYNANFDLQDCDRILRVKSTGDQVKATSLIRVVMNFGYHAEMLNEADFTNLVSDQDLLRNQG
ncbi:MAG: hypothetical protein ABI477_14390 [Chryseolinea sp.]